MALRNSSTATPKAIEKLAQENLAMASKIKTLEKLLEEAKEVIREIMDPEVSTENAQKWLAQFTEEK